MRSFSSSLLNCGNLDQAREVAAQADAVVAGSVIVRKIAEAGNDPDLLSRIA